MAIYISERPYGYSNSTSTLIMLMFTPVGGIITALLILICCVLIIMGDIGTVSKVIAGVVGFLCLCIMGLITYYSFIKK